MRGIWKAAQLKNVIFILIWVLFIKKIFAKWFILKIKISYLPVVKHFQINNFYDFIYLIIEVEITSWIKNFEYIYMFKKKEFYSLFRFVTNTMCPKYLTSTIYRDHVSETSKMTIKIHNEQQLQTHRGV